MPPRFSVCVPNYNYARYLRATIASALEQTTTDLEVVVSDNASTDDSLAITKGFDDPRVTVRSNAHNLGFSQNLHAVGEMATGEWMLLLSSDDLMEPQALATYAKLIDHAKATSSGRLMLSAGCRIIDSNGRDAAEYSGRPFLWANAKRDEAASIVVGLDVFAMPAKELLRASLRLLRTPLPFLATAYPRDTYLEVGGFGSSQTINPDKHLAWRLMGVSDTVYFVDAPLFAYRVHPSNQGALQARSGALKHLTDQYSATFALQDFVLEAAGLTRDDLAAAFVEHDVALRGMVAVADGNRSLARRTLEYGRAAYPELVARSARVTQLSVLLGLGPLGVAIARRARERELTKWRRTNPLSEAPH